MQFMRVPWLARAFVPGVAAVAAAAAAVEAEVTANGVLHDIAHGDLTSHV